MRENVNTRTFVGNIDVDYLNMLNERFAIMLNKLYEL